MHTRTKTASWIGVSLVLCSIFACSVSVNRGAGTVTIAGQTFAVPLGLLGIFEIFADGPPATSEVQVQELFTGTPERQPGTAVVALNPSNVKVTPLGEQKGRPGSQVISGSANLDVYIDSEASTTPCTTGVFVGSFGLTFNDDSVSIDSVNLALSPAAFAHVLSGSFTMCLQMTGTVNATITIDGLSIDFGPPVDEVECTSDNNCADGETCMNGECVPASTAECLLNTDCDERETCINGACVPDTQPECTSNTACDTGEICVNAECVPEGTTECVFNTDCDSGESCINGQCVPDTVPDCTFNTDCGDGEACVGGVCVPEGEDFFSLTIGISGQGGVDPSGGAYSAGQQVTLTATPADGWRFDSWEGDLTGGENPATITINADTAITANFLQAVGSAITFRATYDRLWDTDEQFPGYFIDVAVLSGDGKKLFWLTHDEPDWNRWAVTMDFDGSNRTMIPLTADTGAYGEAAIDQDGSRAFFRRGDYIYKVEGGAVSQILYAFDWDGVGPIEQIQTVADGSYVYFLEDIGDGRQDRDLRRVSHAGGTPELLIDDLDVPCTPASAGRVFDYEVSDDGSIIAFARSGCGTLDELFINQGGAYTKLSGTDNADIVYLSGDGSTIVFRANVSEGGTWESIQTDGTSRTELAPVGHNFSGIVMPYDGSKIFYADTASGGSVLLNTDGSGRLNIFPGWNVTNIAIGATFHYMISDDGTRVAFYTQYGIKPLIAAYYSGYLDDPAVTVPPIADAPFIASVTASPPSMPTGDPDATVVFSLAISDQDGQADITNTVADELVDGLHANRESAPAYFPAAIPFDTGESPDAAVDGIYTVVARPGDLIGSENSMTVRFSTMDAAKTVTVADMVLPIGN